MEKCIVCYIVLGYCQYFLGRENKIANTDAAVAAKGGFSLKS